MLQGQLHNDNEDELDEDDDEDEDHAMDLDSDMVNQIISLVQKIKRRYVFDEYDSFVTFNVRKVRTRKTNGQKTSAVKKKKGDERNKKSTGWDPEENQNKKLTMIIQIPWTPQHIQMFLGKQ